MKRLSAIHVVYAKWCPHCVPTTVEPMQRLAAELGIPCTLYDIDSDVGKAADKLVKRYGDWSEDYTIPQVFFEMEGGSMEHVLTGDPRGTRYTRQAVEALLDSEPVRSMRYQGQAASKPAG